MQPVARLGDRISHGGQITSASPDVKADGIGVARVNDTASCAVHGTVTITTGSPTGRKANGRAIARVTSQCSCGATIVTGSPDVVCA